MSKINLNALNAEEAKPEDAIKLILADLQAVAIEVGRRRLIHLTGSDRLVMPLGGTVQVFMVPSLDTTSDGSNYHTVSVIRNGQAEDETAVDTSLNELTAYDELHIGTIQVGRGDVVSLQVVTTGLPYPILSLSNLSLRCELSPTNSKEAT